MNIRIVRHPWDFELSKTGEYIILLEPGNGWNLKVLYKLQVKVGDEWVDVPVIKSELL